MREKFEKNQNFDIVADKLELLKVNFPQCFTREGNLDFKKLETELSEEMDIVREGYSLNWLGKSYAKIIANLETETVVSPDLEHNSIEENKRSQNVYIKGDNLNVLKHLVNAYTGKIKMVYIDPPYNTGSDDFIYQDNFNFTPDKLGELANIDIEEAKRVLEFTERKSNSHSAWLTFMYPRLFIARELLEEDGVIFISINDIEQANLKLVCDEIFGEENFVTNFVWQNKKGGGNDSTHIAIEHEYVTMYAKKKTNLPPLFEDYQEGYLARYKEEDEQGKYYWDTFKRKSAKQYYPISCPDGTLLEKDKYGNPISWLRSETTFYDNLNSGEVKIVQKEDGWGVYFKQRLPKGKKPRSLYFKEKVLTKYGLTSEGSDEILELFQSNVFNNPKPVDLIKYFINVIFEEDEGIVLDFFSGSATTAQAIMEVNNGLNNIKFILVQIQEDIKKEKNKNAYNFCAINSLEQKITSIGIERVKRASQKIHQETGVKIGFKVFETKAITEKISENDLSKMLTFTGALLSDNTILNQFGKETVLTTWMLEDAHPLTVNYEEIDLGAGYVAYKAEHTLYLLDGEFTIDTNLKVLIEKVEKEAIEFKINKIVLFGYSFATETIASLQDNMKHLRNGHSSADIHVEVRY